MTLIQNLLLRVKVVKAVKTMINNLKMSTDEDIDDVWPDLQVYTIVKGYQKVATAS